jgi:hypothetical protein
LFVPKFYQVLHLRVQQVLPELQEMQGETEGMDLLVILMIKKMQAAVAAAAAAAVQL